MAKLTLDDLRKLRESKKTEMERRNVDGKDMSVIIGMGTCGIAAGAKVTFDTFVEALAGKPELKSVIIRQTGCMGLCHAEPTVEVAMPGMPSVIYGKVDADVARKIVQEHLLNRRLVGDHVFDKPAADIIKPRGK
ncbi:MAG: (2Fe-2S) ferredoxin domain-containing protein [Kiritimatiellia bacterium]